jgi:hypothetical protein
MVPRECKYSPLPSSRVSNRRRRLSRDLTYARPRNLGVRGAMMRKLFPELVVSATGNTKAALDTEPADDYTLANRTRELGLLHGTVPLVRLSTRRIEASLGGEWYYHSSYR